MAEVSGALIGGRYQLLELIGQGGMGRVWRGRDETLGREVAVKEVTLPHDVGEEQREVLLRRVLREARSAARLAHPGIITVHDVVEHDGAPVIVMEYVAGTSLAGAVAREGHLPVRQVAEIGVQMLRALGRAHAQGIVHRDLKPDNVLLADERVVITDFGIAHVPDATVTLTHTGAVMGTPVYMAPEQLQGRPTAPAGDLWSLGATLYTAVEGTPPFAAETFPALCVAVITQEPRAVERAGPLAPVLTALLTKDPDRRATAEEALAALEAVVRDPAAAGVPAQRGTRAPAPVRAPLPSAPAVRRGPQGAPALLLRGVGVFGLVWAGTALPWNEVHDWVRPSAVHPRELLVSGTALVAAAVNAAVRPRLPAAAAWLLFVVVNAALLVGVKLVWPAVWSKFPMALPVNALLLGTCCWALWRAVPGRRSR
ncbi:serine/threonine-protein kinase [Streptomyces sp. NPDC058646]|uniref:serine/threonine-protein kinase n=1 Tax=Streptomyces sp. NPDC058646 TaxID=3346574 RepID=UPI0036507D3B